MSRSKIILSTTVAAFLTLLGITTLGYILTHKASPQAQAPLQHISFTINAAGYSSDTDSPIPLEISGTDTSGKTVKQEVFIDLTNPSIDISQGSYTVHVVASPLIASGKLYGIPKDVTLDENTHELAINFDKLDAKDITEDAMQASKEAALRSGMSADAVDKLYQALVAYVGGTLQKTGSLLEKYQPILETINSMNQGEAHKDQINLTEAGATGRIVVRFEDIDKDGTDDLLVGWGKEAEDMSGIYAKAEQIFSIVDGKPQLVFGNEPDAPETNKGPITFYSDGIQRNTPNDPSRLVTNYKVGPQWQVQEISHYYTADNGMESIRVDGQTGEESSAGVGSLYTVAKAEVTGQSNEALPDGKYELAGNYILNYLFEKRGLSLDAPEFQTFDTQTLTGSFSTSASIGPDAATITIDSEKHMMHLEMPYYFVNSGQESGSFDLSFDDDTFFGTDVGSAPVWGKLRYSLDEFAQKFGQAPGVSFYVKDGRILLAYFHS